MCVGDRQTPAQSARYPERTDIAVQSKRQQETAADAAARDTPLDQRQVEGRTDRDVQEGKF